VGLNSSPDGRTKRAFFLDSQRKGFDLTFPAEMAETIIEQFSTGSNLKLLMSFSGFGFSHA
jgi:hypothetical protein